MATAKSENGPASKEMPASSGDSNALNGKEVESNEKEESKQPETVEMEDEEEDVIDEEQLEDYREMVDDLGTWPDKVKINSLSMVAEDHADSPKSAAALYDCIRTPLVSPSVSKERKLPLVYVLDSILKNVKGEYIRIVEKDAKTWMPVVYNALPEEQGKKLKRVWNMWRDANLFSEANWKEMGTCFSAPPAVQASKSRAADGTLQIPVKLRKEMQAILDDVQSNVTNELDKVSLERLADINPDLLAEIQKTAQDVLSSGQSGGSGASSSKSGGASQSQTTATAPSFLVETRSPEWIASSAEWKKIKLKNPIEESQALITTLQEYVNIADDTFETTYTQADAIQMTNVLAASSVTATLLTNALQQLQEQEDDEKENASANAGTRPVVRHFLSIDKSLFTNDGVKQKDETVIGSLYEGGLPFVSSADGKRFATQTELSNHLDFLFKKTRLEKSMERTEERGWYVDGSVWTGEVAPAEVTTAGVLDSTEAATSDAPVSEADRDPASFTVPADESRDRCVICGINFKMFFDNEDGIYMYSNCREIEVLNDDAAEKESESMLVHVTCWRDLSSPEVLTSDQALQETHHY